MEKLINTNNIISIKKYILDGYIYDPLTENSLVSPLYMSCIAENYESAELFIKEGYKVSYNILYYCCNQNLCIFIKLFNKYNLNINIKLSKILCKVFDKRLLDIFIHLLNNIDNHTDLTVSDNSILSLNDNNKKFETPLLYYIYFKYLNYIWYIARYPKIYNYSKYYLSNYLKFGININYLYQKYKNIYISNIFNYQDEIKNIIYNLCVTEYKFKRLYFRAICNDVNTINKDNPNEEILIDFFRKYTGLRKQIGKSILSYINIFYNIDERYIIPEH